MRALPANLRFLTRLWRFGMTSLILGLTSYQGRRRSQKNSAGSGFPDSGGACIIVFDRAVFDSGC